MTILIIIRKKCLGPLLLLVKVLEKEFIFGNTWKTLGFNKICSGLPNNNNNNITIKSNCHPYKEYATVPF